MGGERVFATRAAVAFGFLALALAALYELGARPPVGVSVAVFATVLILAVARLRAPAFPFLCLYILGLYALPFTNLVENVIHPPEYFRSQPIVWGLATNEYEAMPDVVSALGLVGAAGAAALAAGMFAVTALRGREGGARTLAVATLGWRGFMALIAGAIAFAWVQAPATTIFDVAYPGGVAPLQACGVRFNASVLMIGLLIGAATINVLSVRGVQRSQQIVILAATTLLVTLWYQLLRGHREAAEIFPAIAILGTFDPAARPLLRSRRVWAAAIAAGVLLVVLLQAVGTLRSNIGTTAVPPDDGCPVSNAVEAIRGAPGSAALFIAKVAASPSLPPPAISVTVTAPSASGVEVTITAPPTRVPVVITTEPLRTATPPAVPTVPLPVTPGPTAGTALPLPTPSTTPRPTPTPTETPPLSPTPTPRPRQDAVAVVRTTRISLQSGPWSGALLSGLSVIGDAERGILRPRLGATYVDYVLSLPPSFVAQAFGYERPIGETRGPAWEMRFGIGGTDLMVIPFVNFRAFGVAVILFLMGALVAWTEVEARRRPTWGRMLWYAAVLIVAPGWVWYGDLYLIRAAMGAVGVWAVVRLLFAFDARQRAGRATA